MCAPICYLSYDEAYPLAAAERDRHRRLRLRRLEAKPLRDCGQLIAAYDPEDDALLCGWAFDARILEEPDRGVHAPLLDADALPDDESVTRDNVAPYVIRTEKRRAIDADGKPYRFEARHLVELRPDTGAP